MRRHDEDLTDLTCSSFVKNRDLDVFESLTMLDQLNYDLHRFVVLFGVKFTITVGDFDFLDEFMQMRVMLEVEKNLRERRSGLGDVNLDAIPDKTLTMDLKSLGYQGKGFAEQNRGSLDLDIVYGKDSDAMMDFGGERSEGHYDEGWKELFRLTLSALHASST